MTEIFAISEPKQPDLDVIFIHGLDGDARQSWSGGSADLFWPKWLADDLDDTAVWTVGYDAWSSKWRGRSMSLQDRGINLLAQFENRGLGKRPLCFIAHSMGGLLVKELLLHAAESRTGFAPFAEVTRGVIFLATPHTGSGLAKAVDALAGIYRKSAAIDDLRRDNVYLRHLNDRYRDWVDDVGIRNLAFFESRPTFGLQVVDSNSANPGIAHTRPIAIDANHIDICKPSSRQSVMYGQVKAFISSLIGGLATVPAGDRRTPTAGPASARHLEAPLSPSAREVGDFARFTARIRDLVELSGRTREQLCVESESSRVEPIRGRSNGGLAPDNIDHMLNSSLPSDRQLRMLLYVVGLRRSDFLELLEVRSSLEARARLSRLSSDRAGSGLDDSLPIDVTLALSKMAFETVVGLVARKYNGDFRESLDAVPAPTINANEYLIRRGHYLSESLVNSLLRDKEIIDSIRACCFSSLGRVSRGSKELVLRAAEETFKRRAGEISPSLVSASLEIWRQLQLVIERVSSGGRISIATNGRPGISHEDYVNGFNHVRGSHAQSWSNSHFSRLIDLVADPVRLASLHVVSEMVSDAFVQSHRRMEMLHIEIDHNLDQKDIYVKRPLKLGAGQGDELATLLLSRTSFRCVVVGSPGTGKSTLVRHTVREVNSAQSAALLLVPVKCRDYAGSDWGIPILQYIRDIIDAQLGLKIEISDLEDIAISGSLCILFDALDEIIDISRRREFVERVETLARCFPALSVVVTSRSRGYENAVFGNDFETATLEEFSIEQVHEYASRWFGKLGQKQVLYSRFLAECSELPDIQSSPLMLSLVCSIYVARGHIPRNRRRVYAACAELLFKRWDYERGILGAEPPDHQDLGDWLMQRLAIEFWENRIRGNELPESQLRQVISEYYTSEAAVGNDESLKRATSFLRYCAGRAWLLSLQGTDQFGNRLFSFTHKTFLEYFTAEAIVRDAASHTQVVDAIRSIYQSDPGSVLPELMIQAANDANGRWASQVILDLLNHVIVDEAYLMLCLRLLNSGPMSAAVAEKFPAALRSAWVGGTIGASIEGAEAVFQLNADAALRIDLTAQADPELRDELCARWSSLRLIGNLDSADACWTDIMDRHTRDLYSAILVSPNIVDTLHEHTALALLRQPDLDDEIAARMLRRTAPLVSQIYGYVIPGPVVEFVRIICEGRDYDHVVTAARRLELVAKRLPHNMHDPQLRWDRVVQSLDQASRRWHPVPDKTLHQRFIRFVGARDVALWLCLLASEVRGPQGSFTDACGGVYGLDVFGRLVARPRTGVIGSAPVDGIPSSLSGLSLPAWFNQWFRGARSFTDSPYSGLG